MYEATHLARIPNHYSGRSTLRALKKRDPEIEAILDLEKSSEWLDLTTKTT